MTLSATNGHPRRNPSIVPLANARRTVTLRSMNDFHREFVDDAFRASLDEEVVSVGDDVWLLKLDSAQIAKDRLWVQLTAYGRPCWMLTVRLPFGADQTSLFGVVATFLRQPDDDHDAIVNAVRTTPSMMTAIDTTVH
jgi:hypothetical protein